MSDIKHGKAKQISMREHIKKRSMWAGSKESQAMEVYVNQVTVDPYSNEEVSVFEITTLHYPPSLDKGIDEIAVNAVDQWVKTGKVKNIDFSCNDEGEITMFDFEGGPCLSVGGSITYQKMKWKIESIQPEKSPHEGLGSCILSVVPNY